MRSRKTRKLLWLNGIDVAKVCEFRANLANQLFPSFCSKQDAFENRVQKDGFRLVSLRTSDIDELYEKVNFFVLEPINLRKEFLSFLLKIIKTRNGDEVLNQKDIAMSLLIEYKSVFCLKQSDMIQSMLKYALFGPICSHTRHPNELIRARAVKVLRKYQELIVSIDNEGHLLHNIRLILNHPFESSIVKYQACKFLLSSGFYSTVNPLKMRPQIDLSIMLAIQFLVAKPDVKLLLKLNHFVYAQFEHLQTDDKFRQQLVEIQWTHIETLIETFSGDKATLIGWIQCICTVFMCERVRRIGQSLGAHFCIGLKRQKTVRILMEIQRLLNDIGPKQTLNNNNKMVESELLFGGSSSKRHFKLNSKGNIEFNNWDLIIEQIFKSNNSNERFPIISNYQNLDETVSCERILKISNELLLNPDLNLGCQKSIIKMLELRVYWSNTSKSELEHPMNVLRLMDKFVKRFLTSLDTTIKLSVLKVYTSYALTNPEMKLKSNEFSALVLHICKNMERKDFDFMILQTVAILCYIKSRKLDSVQEFIVDILVKNIALVLKTFEANNDQETCLGTDPSLFGGGYFYVINNNLNGLDDSLERIEHMQHLYNNYKSLILDPNMYKTCLNSLDNPIKLEMLEKVLVSIKQFNDTCGYRGRRKSKTDVQVPYDQSD